MSLETPNRTAAYLRLDVPDLAATPNVLNPRSQVNVASIDLFDVDSILAGVNVIFTNKISREQGVALLQNDNATNPQMQFGTVVAPADPFFDVEAGDWTTNGILPVPGLADNSHLLGIMWFQGPLLP